MHISAFLVENVYMDTHSIENSKHMFNMIRKRMAKTYIQNARGLSLIHIFPVGMEVGGTHSIEDCWKLVGCYEETQTPFMFLENCCYNESEALATSLVRNGVLGEVSFCQ